MTDHGNKTAIPVDNDSSSPSLFTDEVRELVAIGAAIAGNCEKCFEHHYKKARELGVTREDMLQAATLGKAIREMPAKSLANRVRENLIANTGMPGMDQSEPASITTFPTLVTKEPDERR